MNDRIVTNQKYFNLECEVLNGFGETNLILNGKNRNVLIALSPELAIIKITCPIFTFCHVRAGPYLTLMFIFLFT